MKLTVIGYWGGYPAADGASSVYLVEKDKYTLALDFGSGALLKLQTFMPVSQLDGLVLSHYHTDHIADIGVLQHALLVNSYITGEKEKLPIYSHKEDEYQFAQLQSDYTEALAYDPHKTLQVGPFKIDFLKTNHSVPCYGMRISDGESTMVYTADTAYQESWLEFVQDADLLLADSNFYSHQDGQAVGHMTSVEAAYIAKEAKVKQLILTHLPQYGDHADLIKDAEDVYDGKIELAYEGLIWQAGK